MTLQSKRFNRYYRLRLRTSRSSAGRAGPVYPTPWSWSAIPAIHKARISLGHAAGAGEAGGRAEIGEMPKTLSKSSVQTSRRVHPALHRTLDTDPGTKLRESPHFGLKSHRGQGWPVARAEHKHLATGHHRDERVLHAIWAAYKPHSPRTKQCETPRCQALKTCAVQTWAAAVSMSARCIVR